jgi:hypothetical protein
MEKESRQVRRARRRTDEKEKKRITKELLLHTLPIGYDLL